MYSFRSHRAKWRCTFCWACLFRLGLPHFQLRNFFGTPHTRQLHTLRRWTPASPSACGMRRKVHGVLARRTRHLNYSRRACDWRTQMACHGADVPLYLVFKVVCEWSTSSAANVQTVNHSSVRSEWRTVQTNSHANETGKEPDRRKVSAFCLLRPH